jgi:hypothetical protein
VNSIRYSRDGLALRKEKLFIKLLVSVSINFLYFINNNNFMNKTFSLFVLLLAIMIIVLINRMSEPTGFITADFIEIDGNEMKTCCYFQENNLTRACTILENYDCSLCSAYCK